jgi:hypothetical protein
MPLQQCFANHYRQKQEKKYAGFWKQISQQDGPEMGRLFLC